MTFYHHPLPRLHFLQSVVAEHQQFDELLLSFSVWIKQFLGELQATSEISLMDHQAALTRHKVKCILLRGKKHLFVTASSSILKGSKFNKRTRQRFNIVFLYKCSHNMLCRYLKQIKPLQIKIPFFFLHNGANDF